MNARENRLYFSGSLHTIRSEMKEIKEEKVSKKWKWCKNCKRSRRINHECTIKFEKKYVESFGEYKCERCNYSTNSENGLRTHSRYCKDKEERLGIFEEIEIIERNIKKMKVQLKKDKEKLKKLSKFIKSEIGN